VGCGLEQGTSSGSPSNSRNVTSIVLRMLNKSWMIDCGEGTQHQLLYSPLKPSTVDKIFVTHLHGDHIWGLPGMIATITYARPMSPTISRGTPPLAHQLLL
jgi:ribonuclease Z